MRGKVKKEIVSLFKYQSFRSLIIAPLKCFMPKHKKERLERIEAEQYYIHKIVKDKTIQSGPFQGMKYPDLEAHCSSLAPKFAGTYELELHGVLEQVINTNYSQVLDIGCAEGYYVVGLAILMQDTKFFAYDIETESLKLCEKMAQLNNVNQRVTYYDSCTAQTLAEFNFSKRSLIISDCEGFEIELFTKENIGNLFNVDLIVELHDIFNPSIKPALIQLFSDSHNIEIIKEKKRSFSLLENLKNLSEYQKKLIMSENRNGVLGESKMEWAIFRSKKYLN